MTIPDRAQVQLVYQATKNFTASTGLDQAFGLNFVYQPGNYSPLNDATYSALGQKNWAQWFQTVFVAGSKIEIELVNNVQRLGTGETPVWFTITPWAQALLASSNTDIQPFQRTPYNKHILIPLNCSIPQKLSHYMSVKKFVGKDRLIDDEGYWSNCLVSANGYDGTCTNKLYWHLGIWNADGTASTLDVTYMVKITYYCTMFRRWQLASN